MKEHDEHIEFEILTGKYLAGETTAEEQVTLENWVKASEANKRLFLEWKHAWQMAGINAMNFNIEKAKQMDNMINSFLTSLKLYCLVVERSLHYILSLGNSQTHLCFVIFL